MLLLYAGAYWVNDPDLMFRRFRYKAGEEPEYDKDGNEIGKKIVWGKKWKKRIKKPDGTYGWIDYDRDSYKTGNGVYKSSAKNAMRVARTETNIAYRRADHERWQQLDFVLGQRVQLSRNHPKEDICDKLAGDYPKDFVFDGWHPQCFCYVTTINLPIEDMVQINKIMDEGGDWKAELKRLYEAKRIKSYPDNFKEWVRDNAENIAAARERGTEPYFIRNNSQAIDKILNPEAEKPIKFFNQDDLKTIKDGSFWGGGSVIRMNKIFKEQGYTQEDINELSKLIDMHRHGGEGQADIDIQIALEFRDPDSKIGSMLRLMSDVEEEAYRIYRQSNPPMIVSRAGKIDRDTFSFTKHEHGVVQKQGNESVGWGVDMQTSVDELLKENRLVGGLLRSDFGYQNEAELFFISKTAKYLTPEKVAEWKTLQLAKKQEAERIESLKQFNEAKGQIAQTIMGNMSKIEKEQITKLFDIYDSIAEGDMQALKAAKIEVAKTIRHATRDAAAIQEAWSKRQNEKGKIRIEANRERYKEYKVKGWKQLYFDENTGGYNVAHEYHQFSNYKPKGVLKTGREAEKWLGEQLANLGKTIEFLPESGINGKSGDMRFDEMSWDCKYIPIANVDSIRSYIKDARKADCVIFTFENIDRYNDVVEAINREIGRYKSLGRDIEELPDIYIFNKGKLKLIKKIKGT